MIRRIVLVLGGLTLAGTVLAEEPPAGDREAGRKLAGQCRTCHGIDGFARIPIAPHIGGEPASYIRAQLAAFREGRRVHEMMTVVAKGLSDQQIADLAAWYGSHVPTATLAADPAQAPELCVACHGEDGIALAEDMPNLAGETSMYIDTQLKAFRGGKRTHEVMTGIAADLTDDEIRAVAEWYGRIKFSVAVAQ